MVQVGGQGKPCPEGFNGLLTSLNRDFTDRKSGRSLCGPLDMEAQAMTIEARIRELGNRHRQLDETIQREVWRPAVDELQVRELKRKKLRLKEEIISLEARAG